MNRRGLFIEKNGLSEEEILQFLGYRTEEIFLENSNLLLTDSFPNFTRFDNKAKIWTSTTKNDYMILIDNYYSEFSIKLEDEQIKAKNLKTSNAYKFLYNNTVGIEAFSHIVQGKINRLVYYSSDGSYEYGKRIKLESDTSNHYNAKNLFGEKDKVFINDISSFQNIYKVIEKILKIVTGKMYTAEYGGLKEIILDKRIVKKKLS